MELSDAEYLAQRKRRRIAADTDAHSAPAPVASTSAVAASPAAPESRSAPNPRLFVRNLAAATTEQDLRPAFERFGKVVEVCIRSSVFAERHSSTCLPALARALSHSSRSPMLLTPTRLADSLIARASTSGCCRSRRQRRSSRRRSQRQMASALASALAATTQAARLGCSSVYAACYRVHV